MRVLVLVEGQTEESFVNNVLASYLGDHGLYDVRAKLIGNARQRRGRGGIKPWKGVKKEILSHIKEDTGRTVTTMVDFYGLPSSGNSGWPGRADSQNYPQAEKAIHVETKMLESIGDALGQDKQVDRFIPFVVMHEFEALLFSDCERFADNIGQPDLYAAFQAIKDEFTSPEDINDSSVTAPSKRVEGLVPGYDKPLLGTLAALSVGIDAMRRECPHFDSWLDTLEVLAD